MKKTLLSMFTLSLFVSVAALAMGDNVATAIPRDIPLELRLNANDRYMGEKDAPVQIVEYASMTCGHCAEFHKTVVAPLKEEFIETGKVRFVMRDLPWDNVSLAVAKVARCAPADMYYSFVDAFFSTREAWIQAENPLEAIKKTARLGGMASDKVDECLNDSALHAQLIAGKEIALNNLGIKGTPTIYINGKELRGAQSYEAVKAIIEKSLAQ